MSAALQVQVEPQWEAIKAVWPRSMSHFTGCGLAPETAYALSMTLQELLENAVKYGAFSGKDRIDVDVKIGSRDVSIEVRHRVEPNDVKLKRLDDTVQWIRGFQSPFEAYVERLKAVSTSADMPGESGLGLVRVAYEGQSVLDFYINEHSVLAISATHALG